MVREKGARRVRGFLGLGCASLVILCCCLRHTSGVAYVNSTDSFVERCRLECGRRSDLVNCGKYRIVRWIHDVVREQEFSYGPVRIVRIPSLTRETILPKLPHSRIFKSGAIDGLNFLRDAVEDLLTKRALVYTIDNSISARSFGSAPMIMDEDELRRLQSRKTPDDDWRLFKKKKSLILPILILLNLIKLKLLLLPILFGVHFIKKLLVLASVVAPSIFSHLKICKVAPHPQPPHMWATAAEAPVDYPTGYGQEEPWMNKNDLQLGLPYMGYHAYRNPYG